MSIESVIPGGIEAHLSDNRALNALAFPQRHQKSTLALMNKSRSLL